MRHHPPLIWLTDGSADASGSTSEPRDEHRWLEDVEGDKALQWVRERNHECTEALSRGAEVIALQKRLKAIYDSKDRIPFVAKRGDHYYNVFQDAEHPRGLWRRTSLESYRTDEPDWEILLDLDELGRREDTNWTWGGSKFLPRSDRHCLVSLSRGGADAVEVREFDLQARAFVDGGFALPEAKSFVDWIDEDHIIVSTDFGEGTLTASGYPRIAKMWKRGTPLEAAEVLLEGEVKDMYAAAFHEHTPDHERTCALLYHSFYANSAYLYEDDALVQLDKPPSAELRLWKDQILLLLRDPWEVGGVRYDAGSLLAAPLAPWLEGEKILETLFTPSPSTSLADHCSTRDHLILTTMEDVKNRVWILTPAEDGWTRSELTNVPRYGAADLWPVDAHESNDYWLAAGDSVTPNTLYLGNAAGLELERLKSDPTTFDASGLQIEQHFATSRDGTKVPYFQVSRRDLDLNGTNPTLLSGYGGFEIVERPFYMSATGAGWLERGGVYVLANIRGGGEYGPRWHQAALKENRHRAYEDFAAIARALVTRGVTSPQHLGAQGGSNGGLLMGNMYTLFPDLWGALVCEVPLLDMRRYTQLLAGASWAAEYGDPEDPEEWAFIRTFSPYHNIDPSRDYPPMLITTSTRDDRVHPGHARKMMAALRDAGKDVLYYENIEGGHQGAANNEQKAFMTSLAYAFLWNHLAPDTSQEDAERS